jgi:hypothetical protein
LFSYGHFVDCENAHATELASGQITKKALDFSQNMPLDLYPGSVVSVQFDRDSLELRQAQSLKPDDAFAAPQGEIR